MPPHRTDPRIDSCPELQPNPATQCPGPACRSFLCSGLSFTVVVHAFVPTHRPGSSTLFGLAVRSPHVALKSSHGGGAPRNIPLPMSSRTHDLIHCASASATNSAKNFLFLEESLHAHRCQSCQQLERQIKQTTGELRVHSTSYDKGSCFAMA